MHTVAVVGHGRDDGLLLESMARDVGARTASLRTWNDTQEYIDTGRPADLYLVNDLLDANGEQGAELIGDVLQLCPETRCMIVSDYQTEQELAATQGAIPGFGKRESRDNIKAKIKDALA